jgi:hypothetical protein
MVAAVMAFLCDNAADEEATSLDLAELRRETAVLPSAGDRPNAIVRTGRFARTFRGCRCSRAVGTPAFR